MFELCLYTLCDRGCSTHSFIIRYVLDFLVLVQFKNSHAYTFKARNLKFDRMFHPFVQPKAKRILKLQDWFNSNTARWEFGK